MSIVLRNLKGSALTYTEMDRNQSQFFYSASVENSGGTLRLHYTGSSLLDEVGNPGGFSPRSVTVSLGGGGATGVTQLVAGTDISLTDAQGAPSDGTGVVTINATGVSGGGTPAGDTTQIQFNDGGSFGADQLFVYDKVNDFVGIGRTSNLTRRLHINDNTAGGAIIRLQANPNIRDSQQVAYLEIGNTNSTIAEIGRVSTSSDDTFINVGRSSKVHFSFGGTNFKTATVKTGAIGILTDEPNRNLTIRDKSGIGLGSDLGENQNRIRPLPGSVWQSAFVDSRGEALNLVRTGLGIHTPADTGEGGNIMIALTDTSNGINRTDERDSNRLLITSYRAEVGDGLEDSPNHIATFTSDRRVGINTSDPNSVVRLDVNGQYKGAYLETNSTVKLDFKNYSVIKVTLTGASSVQPTFQIPPAGTKGVLIITSTDLNTLLKLTNATTTGNVTITSGKLSTFTFVSDGTNFIETSRTIDMD